MQGLTLLVGLLTLAATTYGWVAPDQPLRWLQHSFSIRIDGKFSRLEIQNAHRDMVQLQKLFGSTGLKIAIPSKDIDKRK